MQTLLCSFFFLFLFLVFIKFTAITGQDAASSHLSWNFLHNDTSEAEDYTVSRLFKAFVKTHNKTYVNNPEEYGRRFIIFKESLKRHIQLNKREREKNGTAVYGVNKFSDWTPQEFKGFLKRGSSKSQGLLTDCEIDTLCCRKFKVPSGPVPPSQDWTKQGKVTPVKNQGKCGSCWAFTAAECVETQWAIAGHPLTELSVQELISCSKPSGCSGGITMCALAWLQNGQFTLAPASECPYVDKETTCQKSLLYEKGAKINCACYSNRSEENSMKPLVGLHGPLGVNVDATMWHDYLGGIIQHHCTDTDINHAVQITGYGFNGHIPYWIVRNSWGPSYGINGYLYIKMGDNLCGVADSPSFVII